MPYQNDLSDHLSDPASRTLDLSPISEIVVPEKADSNDSLTKLYKQDVSYIDTKLTDLYFTGYTQTSLGFTTRLLLLYHAR